jgi:hypothetical protein
MIAMKLFLRVLGPMLLSACAIQPALSQAQTILFAEPGFPTADSSVFSTEILQQGLAGARIANAAQLPEALADLQSRLLVMPYGSAYPEQDWPAILRFLDRGGDLIVLGGKPFTRAAYRKDGEWRLRPPSVAASLELFIHDYQETPGSQGLRFETNPDVNPQLPAFEWTRAFSPVIRLSVTSRTPVDLGSTGNEDAYLTTLAWGEQNGHRLAAPVILIDHVGERFVGGRWIFVACNAVAKPLENTQLVAALQTLALRRNDRFTFRPRVPLFLPGEPLEFHFRPAKGGNSEAGDELHISVRAEEGPAQEIVFPADANRAITLPQSIAEGHGLRTVEATLRRNGTPLWTYRSGFWMRDWPWLLSGPKLSVGSDYFLLDGKPLPVVGTTYMASDVNRLYLYEPNAYVCDQDMKQIHAAGLNMLRSGIWTGWDLLVNPDKSMTEEALRSIEAFLMTARRYGLPVQFNLFAFVPDAFGGSHAYLDPEARNLQDRYVTSLVRRFHDVPFLAWDLINEPSANKNVWRTVPQKEEESAWRNWLKQRYPDEAALLAAWAEPSFGIGRALQSHPTATEPEAAAADPFALPEAEAFDPDAVRGGHNLLKGYDYDLFTQWVFRDWVQHLRDAIRGAGSNQLITVGQDEGGVAGRVSPAFFSPDVSFTATHTWWDFDSILWAGLAAKMPGKPMLVQEMGEQRRLTQDDRLRLSAEEESWQLERKLAIAFAQGAGGIEWVWNVNATMANDNEIPIGAIRPDGTEKPEAQVLAGFAKFAGQHPASFTSIEPPAITVVTSQAQLYSGMWGLAVEMQKKAVRTLAYFDRQPLRMVPENRIAELGRPRLVILPSAQALTEDAWQALLAYVADGGRLLVTGPVEYDEHWQKVDRLSALHLSARIGPLDVRQSVLNIPGADRGLQVSYPSDVQTAPVETMRFANGESVVTAHHGKGTILWAADPVEFAEEYEPAAALYRFAEKAAGVIPVFRELRPLSPGVLAFPTVTKDAILYSFSSECFDDQPIDIEDSSTKARIHFTLPAQRGAAVVLGRASGTVLASYGMSEH